LFPLFSFQKTNKHFNRTAWVTIYIRPYSHEHHSFAMTVHKKNISCMGYVIWLYRWPVVSHWGKHW